VQVEDYFTASESSLVVCRAAPSGVVRGQSDDKSDDNDTSDEGGQGRSETARRGSLDGPGNAIVTMEEEALSRKLRAEPHSWSVIGLCLTPLSFRLVSYASSAARSGMTKPMWSGPVRVGSKASPPFFG
jgi:hypothetical protein